MAAKELVVGLSKMFQEAKKEGLIVNAFGLAPAYHGMVKDCFTLGVSAPSLSGIHKYDKMEIIINLLWSKLSLDERGMIDHVRVFDNEEILDDLNTTISKIILTKVMKAYNENCHSYIQCSEASEAYRAKDKGAATPL